MSRRVQQPLDRNSWLGEQNESTLFISNSHSVCFAMFTIRFIFCLFVLIDQQTEKVPDQQF